MRTTIVIYNKEIPIINPDGREEEYKPEELQFGWSYINIRPGIERYGWFEPNGSEQYFKAIIKMSDYAKLK